MTDKSPLKIRRMFAAITPVYDLMNRLMSAGADARWRRAAARRCAGARRVLDVATGTGDMAAAVGRGVVGLDCTRAMMERARRKYGLPLVEGDALRLPFRDGSFDACTVAFGVRNFADLDRGLREMARVLAPGGRMVILELVMPGGRWTSAYLARFIPALARVVAGRSEAYRYLAESIADFARADELRRRVESAGYAGVTVERLTLGFACIVTATRSAS
jgi:demethylmenaquinone methyltransferase/2-methoxy-6-polyprenyl-1,4-benzoquinol methylase